MLGLGIAARRAATRVGKYISDRLFRSAAAASHLPAAVRQLPDNPVTQEQVALVLEGRDKLEVERAL